MKQSTSWTVKLPDGLKRETRVHITHRGLKWQFKRSDEERWDYDSPPDANDWDRLEDILRRRAGRGKGGDILLAVQKLRAKAGH
jgi:hypothetical protein